MGETIYSYLADDHRRLEDLLQQADGGNAIEPQAYVEFRGGLLRHIGMEEKILLPAARSARGGEPGTAGAPRPARHRGPALAALLVPSPTSVILAAIKTILDAHDVIEEGPEGVYEQCEELIGTERESL